MAKLKKIKMKKEKAIPIKAYKVFNPDMTCQNFKFEVGKEYKHEGSLKLCERGFHFCTQAAHCFDHYNFDSQNIVCEVEILGEIDMPENSDKGCTNHILIGRKLEWNEVLNIVNVGKDNTGIWNTGNWNTGRWNTGNWNTGRWNTGNWNTGYSNTGDRNTGSCNTGNWNTGRWNTGSCNTGRWNTGSCNTGDRNTGSCNTGRWNTGDRNTGSCNTGDRNTGRWNTGDRNTGYSNTGDRNTGSCNTGDRNTGRWNTGSCNTGYSNTGDRNTGVFCTGEKYMDFFNKKSKLTEHDFLNSKAYSLLCQVGTKIWVQESAMSAEEKEKYPSYKTCEGYLKDIPFKEAFQERWHNWSEENRSAFTSLPNFDAKIFKSITGIAVRQKKSSKRLTINKQREQNGNN